MNIEQEITALKKRNVRVEKDKRWETSWTRRIALTIFTYLCAYLFLRIIRAENAELASVVPAMGFWLSTLQASPLRKIVEYFSKN